MRMGFVPHVDADRKKMLETIGVRSVDDLFEATTGEKPGEVNVDTRDELTSPKLQRKTDPGSRLVITGTLNEIHKEKQGRRTKKLDMVLEASWVETIETEFEDLEISEVDKAKILELGADPRIFERLVRSMAPSMYGLEDIKEAIILQLFGGVPTLLPDTTRIRGDIHILMVGDPSAGKTQLLKLVSKIVPRGRYVSGKGVSGAGLTATVMKDEEFGGWVLEAGAIVLANKGTVCIDEFDKVSKEDLVNLHECMSTQTVSIAKATIQAVLPAQTALIAAANPKLSRFDPYKSVAEQIDIPDTLMSRFDLKFTLKDVPDKEKDLKLVDHVIKTRMNQDDEPPRGSYIAAIGSSPAA